MKIAFTLLSGSVHDPPQSDGFSSVPAPQCSVFAWVRRQRHYFWLSFIIFGYEVGLQVRLSGQCR